MKEELIKILLDKNADESDRDDAASWLRDCTDNETLEALYKIASDKNDNYFVQVKVGSVMGEILTKRNTFEQDKHYLIGPYDLPDVHIRVEPIQKELEWSLRRQK